MRILRQYLEKSFPTQLGVEILIGVGFPKKLSEINFGIPQPFFFICEFPLIENSNFQDFYHFFCMFSISYSCVIGEKIQPDGRVNYTYIFLMILS